MRRLEVASLSGRSSTLLSACSRWSIYNLRTLTPSNTAREHFAGRSYCGISLQSGLPVHGQGVKIRLGGALEAVHVTTQRDSADSRRQQRSRASDASAQVARIRLWR